MSQAHVADEVHVSRAPVVQADEAWNAVLTRDLAFDGRFVYAVATTGVYCRPGCPSRRPRRENVTFFPTVAAAAKAGYRACRRCKPAEPRTLSKSEEGVMRVKRVIDAGADSLDSSRFTLNALAETAGLSPFHLQRQFTRIVGASPRAYVAARRAERLKAQLRQGATVTDATYEAGFGSSRAAYEQGVRTLGMTPETYRRGGTGVRIAYASADTPFGRLLVAATDRGICRVMLGDDDQALARSLAAEFPKASIEKSEDALGSWLQALVAQVDGQASPSALPLDVRGTAFQHRVWKALQQIPFGETRSYTDVAKAIGLPSASRAVARACASNPVALVVPCHRVVRTDGTSGGYRWGASRKQAILEHERRRAGR